MPIGQLTFPKTKRLTSSADFAHVREQGRVFRGALLTLGVINDVKTVTFRAGFITSRRVGNAVQRNRVRRRLREIVRQRQHAFRSQIWFVTIARRAAAQATYGALEDEWLRLATRASILARS